MAEEPLDVTIRNIDVRVTRIEQFLPALTTREELQIALAPLATREEMHAAIRTEGERARRHATALFEDLRDDNRIILEHLLTLSARVDTLASR